MKYDRIEQAVKNKKNSPSSAVQVSITSWFMNGIYLGFRYFRKFLRILHNEHSFVLSLPCSVSIVLSLPCSVSVYACLHLEKEI